MSTKIVGVYMMRGWGVDLVNKLIKILYRLDKKFKKWSVGV